MSDFLNFLENAGDNPNLLTAAGSTLGIPSCMLNLGAEALALIPTPILAAMDLATQKAQARAQSFIKYIISRVQLKLGIIEFDTETGLLQFKTMSSLGALGSNIAGIIGGFLEAASFATAFAGELYSNYQSISNQINAISDCLDKFKSLEEVKQNPGSLSINFNELEAAKKSLESTVEFSKNLDSFQNLITNELAKRANDPSLEPKFVDNDQIKQIIEGLGFEVDSIDDTKESPFRLTYGPPKSIKGQYLLSIDGLYYDSQTGGLDPIFVKIKKDIDPGDVWKYNFDPNLGGKGTQISLKSLNEFTDTLFDPEIIDDGSFLTKYYDNDHFLQVLKQQRNKRVYDLKLKIDKESDISVKKNLQQEIISELSLHDEKINKRKKQIEVAVKAPSIYGDGTFSFPVGKIPINDFTYLQDLNLSIDLSKQKKLVFDYADVDGIILPVEPKFVYSSPKADSVSYGHLNVPKVGKGQIIYTPDEDKELPVLSLTDEIHTNSLFAIYNFLEPKTVLPSSLDFNVANCASEDLVYNNAQLVATHPDNVFFSGLAIPYLEGIVKNKSTLPESASALGSFIKLPQTTEFNSLMYNPSGFSIDFWTYVPNIFDPEIGWLSSTTSSLTKVILGCENFGSINGTSQKYHTGEIADLDYLKNNKGDSFVRGFLMGFTRDRRITQSNTGYSNDNDLNNTTSSLSFFVAPTISRDGSSASWINTDECLETTNYFKFKVDLKDSILSNVSGEFTHFNLSVDPYKGNISLYCDGSSVATSSLSDVFGNNLGVPPELPTFKKNNSFEYSTSTVDAPLSIQGGPKLNTYYTPWIVGGGYTDGSYYNGNFLGGDRGGIVSGLRGFIGSLKFYSSPLNNKEVLKNFSAQKGFFKNILI